MTGNVKESIIPYVLASMKQIKIIDRFHTDSVHTNDLTLDWKQNLDKLKNYADNYLKTNSNREEILHENNLDQSGLSRPEVESLMANVKSFSYLDYLF